VIYDCQHPDHIGDRRISDRRNVFKERRDFRSIDHTERGYSRETGVVWCRGCMDRERREDPVQTASLFGA
jgi:hypothetical protein